MNTFFKNQGELAFKIFSKINATFLISAVFCRRQSLPFSKPPFRKPNVLQTIEIL